MITFVTCSATSCPSNKSKSCRAKRISVSEKGVCSSFNQAVDQSPTENYVNIESCACHKCDNWEVDEVTNLGKCGASSQQLHFESTNDGPMCLNFKNQIGQPGFATNV